MFQRWLGTGVGSGSASRTSWLNFCNWKRLRASAITFTVELKCWALTTTFKCRHCSVKARNTVITWSDLEVMELTICTTAKILTMKAISCYEGPHPKYAEWPGAGKAQAQLCPLWFLNPPMIEAKHNKTICLQRKHQSQDQTPAALSVKSWRSSLDVQNLSWKTETPLKSLKNRSQSLRSFLMPAKMLRWWCGLVRPHVELISLLQNGLPGMIARQAKLREPINDCICLRVHFARSKISSIFILRRSWRYIVLASSVRPSIPSVRPSLLLIWIWGPF